MLHLTHEPHKDVRVQRTSALRFELAAERKHGSDHAGSGGGSRCAVGAPLSCPSACFLTTAVEGFWPYIQDHLKEEADHELEHDRLRDRVLCKSPQHLPVFGYHIFHAFQIVKHQALALHNEEQDLVGICKVGC